jgi:hypothetical protein
LALTRNGTINPVVEKWTSHFLVNSNPNSNSNNKENYLEGTTTSNSTTSIIPQGNRRGPNQLSLLDFTNLVQISQRSPNFQIVDSSWSIHLSNSVLNAIVKDGRLIETLRLSSLQPLPPAVTPSIFQQLTMIKSLDLTHWRHISEETMTLITRNCTRLQVLELRDFPLQRLSIKTTLPELHTLDLSDSLALQGEDALSDVASHCTNLQVLKLTGCINLPAQSVQAIVIHCPKLKDLDLSKCKLLLDDALLFELASSCRQQLLSLNLNLSRFEDKSSSSLKTTSSPKITSKGINRLAKSCNSLHSLRLCGVGQHVTETGLMEFARRCTSLQTLDLSQWRHLTNSVMNTITSYCPLLRMLILNDCPQLSDATLFAIAKNCTQLEVLKVCKISFFLII